MLRFGGEAAGGFGLQVCLQGWATWTGEGQLFTEDLAGQVAEVWVATPNLCRAPSPPPGDGKQALQVDHVHAEGVASVCTQAWHGPRCVQLCVCEPVTCVHTTLFGNVSALVHRHCVCACVSPVETEA